MLAVSWATILPQNLAKNTTMTKVFFYSALRRHKPYRFLIPGKMRPWKDRGGTTRRIGGIKMVAIAASAAPGLRALSGRLESTRPKPQLEIIVTTIGQRDKKIKTWIKPPVTIITNKAILPTNALNLVS